MLKQPVVPLEAFFDLKDGVSEEEFKKVFEPFAQHLVDAGFALSYTLELYSPDESDLAREEARDFCYHASFFFRDAEAEQRCWVYVREDPGAVRALHRAMNRKVGAFPTFRLNGTPAA